ncbi:hypothetical protein ABN763_10100 [Spongiivirga sp. MCCC 1A20706]|uniref:hypothetical protein n=1 Tax=Spongiivirga sp. MCCC 1A20706 TaxID=3160963 RepID=UPI0039778661
MKTKILIHIIFAFVCFSSCKLKKESSKWRAQVNKSIEDITKAVDGISKAVPGERYLRLIDKARTGTAEEKEQARKDIIAIFGVDPQNNNWEVVINFNYNTSRTIQADAIMNLNNFSISIDQAVLENRINIQKVGSTLIAPLNETELRTKIFGHVSKAVGLMSGEPKYHTFGNNTKAQVYWPNSAIMPTPFRLDGGFLGNAKRKLEKEVNEKIILRSTINEEITNAIWSLREPLRRRQLGEPNLRFDWDPIDGGNVIVFIDENDLNEIKEKHGNNHIIVEAVIKDKINSLNFKNYNPFLLRVSDFLQANRSIKIGKNRTCYWAIANLTRTSFINPETYISVEELKKGITELKKLNAENIE